MRIMKPCNCSDKNNRNTLVFSSMYEACRTLDEPKIDRIRICVRYVSGKILEAGVLESGLSIAVVYSIRVFDNPNNELWWMKSKYMSYVLFGGGDFR